MVYGPTLQLTLFFSGPFTKPFASISGECPADTLDTLSRVWTFGSLVLQLMCFRSKARCAKVIPLRSPRTKGPAITCIFQLFLFRFAFYLSCTLHPAPYNVHLHRPAVRRLPFPNHRRSITFSYPISFTPCTVNLISSSLSPFALFQNCNCKMPPNSV